MRFWLARARKSGAGVAVAALAYVVTAAAAASAVQVSLPPNVVINMVGPPPVNVDMTIGSVTGLESVSVSFTFDPAIVSPGTVSKGALAAACDNPVVNTMTAGRLTITMPCSSMPITGSGTLFTIAFTGVANGVSPLTFSTLIVDGMVLIPNGCQLNEGTPTCEPSNGQITVGPTQPTSTASTTATITATRTTTATATATASVPPTSTSTATNTTAPLTTATSTATRSATPTITDTPTSGPSPTASQTRTVSNTPTITATSSPTNTTSPTLTTTDTPIPTSTRTRPPTATVTNTREATPTRPAPIPVAPSPTSPAGLAMVGGLALALLWTLRRFGRS